MCFDVVFLYETCLFTRFSVHVVLTFTPYYIIMVKGLMPLTHGLLGKYFVPSMGVHALWGARFACAEYLFTSPLITP